MKPKAEEYVKLSKVLKGLGIDEAVERSTIITECAKDNRMEYIQEQKKLQGKQAYNEQASQKQLDFLGKKNIFYNAGITKGRASDLISDYIKKNSTTPTNR